MIRPRYPQRPHPKAVEGRIVHEAIELLVRALGTQGQPAIGSIGFHETVREIDFWGFFARETERWNERLAQHPRFGPQFVLRTAPRELANQAIRMFREQYRPSESGSLAKRLVGTRATGQTIDLGGLLRAKGALAEVRVRHPELPFVGVIDLVRLDGDEVEVVDFKTGKVKDDHERQVLLYGLLWWRVTGEAPSRVSLQYLGERRSWTATTEGLRRAEEELEQSIEVARSGVLVRPAPAQPGPDCSFCPARARCDEGWGQLQSMKGRAKAGIVDVEVVVESEPSATGFVGRSTGHEVNVVYEAAVGAQLPKMDSGAPVRVVDGVVLDQGKTIEIRAWTEVYPRGA